MADYTILLIDYEPRSIQRLRAPLERAGYRIEFATDGHEGIVKFHSLKPSAVIIEAMLPKRHGFEVCKELKETPHGNTCPVMIATSFYRGRKYRHQAMHLYSCDAYLEKPIADEELIQVVQTALQDYAEARKKTADEALEIDQTLLGEETPTAETTAAAVPRASAAPEHKTPKLTPAPAGGQPEAESADVETELEIIDRLDSIFGEDSSD